MKSKKNLILIGMMGSGKSIIGSLISKNLNIKFIDIDNVLENDSKMKIAEIFEKIDFPSPNKAIEKIIPNENLKIVK